MTCSYVSASGADYSFLIGAWFACDRVVDVFEARLIKFCRPSSLLRSLVDFAIFNSCRFGFVFDDFLSLSLIGEPFADLGSAGTSFSAIDSRSASSVRWAGPSTMSLSILKKNFFPTIFCWFRERMESSLEITSILRISFQFSGSHSM